MKKIISMIGIGAALLLAPSCKKSEVKPQEPVSVNSQSQRHGDTASLYVLLNSKPCETPQNQYSSATVDIREIKVFNTEHGWESLTTVPGAWDVVSLQTATVPVADLTEKTTVHAGTITKIALTFGTNNHLVVNNTAAECYRLGTREVILDIQGELRANTLNELVVNIDICGNITLNAPYGEVPCYTLNPVMSFHSLNVVNLQKL